MFYDTCNFFFLHVRRRAARGLLTIVSMGTPGVQVLCFFFHPIIFVRWNARPITLEIVRSGALFLLHCGPTLLSTSEGTSMPKNGETKNAKPNL